MGAQVRAGASTGAGAGAAAAARPRRRGAPAGAGRRVAQQTLPPDDVLRQPGGDAGGRAPLRPVQGERCVFRENERSTAALTDSSVFFCFFFVQCGV